MDGYGVVGGVEDCYCVLVGGWSVLLVDGLERIGISERAREEMSVGLQAMAKQSGRGFPSWEFSLVMVFGICAVHVVGIWASGSRFQIMSNSFLLCPAGSR